MLKEISKKLNQSKETIEQSIDIMDRLALSQKEKFSTKEQLDLLLCGSILLGSKNDEMDDNIPICKRIQSQFNLRHTDRDAPDWNAFVEFERETLYFFNWNLKIPISLNFVQHFLAAGVVFEEEYSEICAMVEEKAMELVLNLGSNFRLRKHLPSQIGAATIFLSRKLNGVIPTWSKELEFLTRSSEETA